MNSSASMLLIIATSQWSLADAYVIAPTPGPVGGPTDTATFFPFLIEQITVSPFSSMRYQQVYNASVFTNVDRSLIYITTLTFFLDDFGRGAFPWTVTNMQINLSTTRKNADGLSSVFAENLGTNDTIVFGPSRHDFPLSSLHERFQILLDRPFPYYPGSGNLLLDVRIFNGDGPADMKNPELNAYNSSTDEVSRVLATNVTAAVAIAGAMLNGSLDNAFNGSFKITAKPQSDQFKYQHQTTDTPSGNPVGEMWVDRFSSHIVEIDQIIKSPGPGSNFTVTITTVTPHFRAPGNNVRVDQVYIGTDPSLIYNGSFKVEDDSPWDPKKLKYIVGSDPSTPTANGFIGVAFQGITNDGGGTAAVVEGNRIFNTRIGGPYHDTFSSKDLIVRNNYYRSVVTGPLKILRGETLYPMPASALTHVEKTAKFTINSSLPHGFTVGQGVRILGATINHGQPPPAHSFNDVYNIESVPTPTTFTYKMATDPQADADAFTGTVNALWQAQQCVIENNIIELIPSYMDWGSPVGIDLIAGPPTPYVDIGARVFRRLVIRNNVIRCVDNLTESTVRNLAIQLSFCEDALVEDNVVDLAIPDPIRHSNSTTVKYFNNRNADGQLIQGVLVPSVGGSVKQDELTTFIEDTTTICIL